MLKMLWNLHYDDSEGLKYPLVGGDASAIIVSIPHASPL